MKRYLYVLAVCLAPMMAAAQNATTGGLTVRSTPPGALATLSGDVTVTGVTPTTLQHRLAGGYTLTVKKHLYETYKVKLELDPARAQALDITLSRKTRWKGAVRSLFVPGWGQLYSEQKIKAASFGVLTLGAGVAFLMAENEFQMRYDRYQASIDRYENSLGDSPTRRGALYAHLQEDQEDAFHAEDVRRATIGVAIGVWALNLIDILFFFPQERATIDVQGVNITPTSDGKSFGLVLSRNF